MEGKIGKKGKMAKNWFKNFQILSNTSKIVKKGNMNIKKGPAMTALRSEHCNQTTGQQHFIERWKFIIFSTFPPITIFQINHTYIHGGKRGHISSYASL